MKQIVIFCDVIDNFGDIGVVFRLARLLDEQYYNVIVITNDLVKLATIHHGASSKKTFQIIENITYIALHQAEKYQNMLSRTDVVIEAFGYQAKRDIMSLFQGETRYINLEYLNTEAWVQELHLTPSYSPYGNKTMFMPSFYPKSGGVLFEAPFKGKRPSSWKIENILKKHGVTLLPKNKKSLLEPIVSKKILLFTYSQSLDALYCALELIEKEHHSLLLCGEKTQKSFYESVPQEEESSSVKIHLMPVLAQEEFDAVLMQCDLLFVRGEDSFVRAVISGKPFLWQAYKQDEEYHLVKVEAFLEIIRPFMSTSHFSLYEKMLIGYNRFKGESLTVSDYIEWFENGADMEKSFKNFSEYVVKNCNLVYNLVSFISSKPL